MTSPTASSGRPTPAGTVLAAVTAEEMAVGMVEVVMAEEVKVEETAEAAMAVVD